MAFPSPDRLSDVTNESALQVIHFMLSQPAPKPLQRPAELSSERVKPKQFHFERAPYSEWDSGKTEASFDALLMAGHQPHSRVRRDQDLVLDLPNKEALRDPNLRRSEANAALFAHQFEHRMAQLCESIAKELNGCA
jgi:hypothetical protein